MSNIEFKVNVPPRSRSDNSYHDILNNGTVYVPDNGEGPSVAVQNIQYFGPPKDGQASACGNIPFGIEDAEFALRVGQISH